MRILLLRRYDRGDLAAHVEDLAATLPAHGFTAVVHDAKWIPENVNRTVDREVSKRLREVGADYDVVHAFGYRAAWACAETYGDDEAWFYTAYDPPRTTDSRLVSRLNQAVAGVCSSRFVRDRLEAVGVSKLETIGPGYLDSQVPLRSAADVRAYYELPSEGPLVGASWGIGAPASIQATSGIPSLLAAWPTVREAFPAATLALLGDSDAEAELPEGVVSLGAIRRGAEFIAACDLWVEPGEEKGWSRALTVAMAKSRACLFRLEGALPELASRDVSGFGFESDEDLGPAVVDALEMELTREAIGNAARVRFEEVHALSRSLGSLATLYRKLLGIT